MGKLGRFDGKNIWKVLVRKFAKWTETLGRFSVNLSDFLVLFENE